MLAPRARVGRLPCFFQSERGVALQEGLEFGFIVIIEEAAVSLRFCSATFANAGQELGIQMTHVVRNADKAARASGRAQRPRRRADMGTRRGLETFHSASMDTALVPRSIWLT